MNDQHTDPRRAHADGETSPLLTKAELAKRLRVSQRSIENWSLKERRIPYLKIGRSIRFDWGTVRAALAKHQVEAVQ